MKIKRKAIKDNVRALLEKELPPLTEEEKAEYAWKGPLEPIPFAEKKEFNVFSMIEGYEREAREVLKAKGYPLTLEGLLSKPARERRIRDIMNMFLCFKEVRLYVSMSEAERAAMSMAYGIRSAMLARIRPGERFIDMGKENVAGGGRGGAKSGETRRNKADQVWEAWQREAEKVWRNPKRSSLGKKDVARIISKKIGGNVDTIRKKIHKPLP